MLLRQLQKRCDKGALAIAARPRRPCHIMHTWFYNQHYWPDRDRERRMGGKENLARSVPIRKWHRAGPHTDCPLTEALCRREAQVSS